jgi:DNA polymerase-3 subunit delta'
LSRTQLIKIPSPENEEIKNALVNNYHIELEKASQIAAVSEGNYREALQLAQNPEEDLQTQVRDWLNIIVKNNVNSQIKWIEEISKIGREKQKTFLKYFIHLLEQAVRTSYLSKESLKNIAEKDLDFSERLNKICTFEAQEEMVKELEKAVYFIERNAHAKMLFHSLTIRFFHIIKDNSVILVH